MEKHIYINKRALLNMFAAITFFAAFSMGLVSCKSKEKAVPQTLLPSNGPTSEVLDIDPVDWGQEGYVMATMIDNSGLDGCGWMLELQNGVKLECTIPEKYCVDQLKVWVNYAPVKGGVSICMAGKMVKLNGIEKVE